MARSASRAGGRRSRGRRSALDDLGAEELLNLRLCDLDVTIEGTWLEERIEAVLGELEARGLVLRPHFWLSDEWSSPDGIPGVAIPFYLAHPRLMALERSQMHDVEGGTRHACMKLLRHEVGHAYQHGYELGRRRAWREIFGSPSRPYPDYYRPNATSKNFVLHLEGWYAQSHPAEDFAETFAVWLRPGSDWRRRYAAWPARRKLEYVDALMAGLVGKPPRVRRRARPYALSTLKKTLREHYEQKREHYRVTFTRAYDRDLEMLFTTSHRADRESAAAFMRRHRRALVEMVCRFAQDHEPVVDHVLDEMIGRSRELGLRVKGRESALLHSLSLSLAVHAVDFARRSAHWWPV